MKAQFTYKTLLTATVFASLAFTTAAQAQNLPSVGGNTPSVGGGTPSVGGNTPSVGGGTPSVGGSTPAPATQATVFRCVNSGGQPATVAQRGDRTTPPMILWQSTAFGPEFTPQVRCQKVSQKLTDAVAANGGSLKSLLLTTGVVNNSTVICFVNNAESCDLSNTLLTLKPENAKKPGEVLAQLLRFGQRGSGSPLFESSGGSEERVMPVSLEEAVNQAFESGGTVNNTSTLSIPNPQQQAMPNTTPPQNSVFTEPEGSI